MGVVHGWWSRLCSFQWEEATHILGQEAAVVLGVAMLERGLDRGGTSAKYLFLFLCVRRTGRTGRTGRKLPFWMRHRSDAASRRFAQRPVAS